MSLSVVKRYFLDMRVRDILLDLIASAIGLVWLAIGFVSLLVVTRGPRRPTPVLDLDYE